MKRWIWLMIVSCLSSALLLEVVSAKPYRFGQSVTVATSAVTQIPPTTSDRVWELVNNARDLARKSQQDQAVSRLSQAFELAKTIDNTDRRNSILVKIIAEYGRIGAYEEAIALLSTISYDERLSDDQGYSMRMQGEVLLTQAYVNEQKYDQALQFTQSINLDAAKHRALVAIVAGYGKIGRFEEAITLSQTLQGDSYQQFLAQTAIVENSIQQKQYEQALTFVQNITNTENRDSILRSLAESAWQSGRYEIALKSSQQITNPSLQVLTLRSLAQAHVAVGQKQPAAAIVSQAFELSQKTDEFDQFSWVEDFLATGQEQRVKAIIDNLTGDEYQLASARFSIAHAYRKVGRYTEALEFAKLIPDRVLLPLTEYPDPKVELFESLIQQSLQGENFSLAKQIALALNPNEDQVIALQTIASQYLKIGQQEQAIEVLNQAVNQAKKIESISIVPERHYSWIEPNAGLLMQLAEEYIKLGQKQRALETLASATESIQNFETQYAFDIPVWHKSQALRQLSSMYLKLDEREKAADLLALALPEAQTLQNNTTIIQELLAIATAYTELGNLQQGAEVLEKTLPLLDTVEQQPEKISILMQIGKGFIAVGQQTQGVELLQTAIALNETLETEQEPISQLIQSISTYAAAGQDAIASQLARRTLEMIQRSEPEYERMAKLEALVVSLTQTDSSALAIEVVQNVPERVDRTRMLIAIAQKYAEKGNTSLASAVLTQAVAVANTIQDETQRDSLFAETARTLAQLYNFPDWVTDEVWRYHLAVQLAKAISDSTTKAELLSQLAFNYRIAGDREASNRTLATAFEMAEGIKERSQWQGKQLELIASAMNLGEYDFALQVANTIQDADYKTVVLRAIAQKYAIAGNKDQAAVILSQAIQEANRIEDEGVRKQAIAGIAQQRPE